MNVFSGRVTASLPLIVSVPSDAVSFLTLPQISSCGKHLACTGAGTGADTELFEGRVAKSIGACPQNVAILRIGV